MARKKSAYRNFRDGGAVLADTPPLPPVAIVDVDRNDTAPDDASVQFKKQIDAQRQAETLQRQRAAQAAPAPPALTKNEMQFLAENPTFLHDRDIAQRALMQAHQGGHVHDSPEFHAAVGEHFKALRPPVEPEQAVTKPIKTSPSDSLPSEPSGRSLYSAPVSREYGYTAAHGGSGGERSGTVRMTPAMKEAARMSGISESEYAENVLRLRREKADGHHGGLPDYVCPARLSD